MRVYVGQTRSAKLIARLVALGFGECVSRGELPPRRHPWFLDNGAFGDWRSGRTFDGEAYRQDLEEAAALRVPPDFIVCPDIVAGGLDSLAFSLGWRDELGSALPGRRVYLVVQDGMEASHVRSVSDRFDGLFVGGSLPWKVATGGAWVRTAHELGMPCHIGRVGTARRVRWAQRIGADSIDSCLPLWSAGHLEKFVAAVGQIQGDLFA